MSENVEQRRVRLAAATQAAEKARALAGRTSKTAPSFLRYILARFTADGCTEVAGSLAYASLLAIVPLLTIGLAMFAAFPAFSDMRNDLQHTLIASLAQGSSDVAQRYLDRFINNAGKATGAGLIGLVVTSILLINTIQVAFDRIWGSTSRKAKWSRLPVYWALITLGPILFGISFSISTYFFRVAGKTDFYGVSAGVEFLANAGPYVLETAGFALFYRLMPTRYVRLPDAVWGGLAAALLFEVVKRLFGLYLKYVSYQQLYGALATIPIFLLWMYLAWITALIGAEVTAALPEWRSGRRSVAPHHRRGDQLSLAVAALALLKQGQAHGSGYRTQDIVRELDADPVQMQIILETLKSTHVIALNDIGRWLLARDLSKLSLHQLCHSLGISLTTTDGGKMERLGSLIERLADQERDMLSRSVDEALASIEADKPELAPEAIKAAAMKAGAVESEAIKSDIDGGPPAATPV
jgi:membrane protein